MPPLEMFVLALICISLGGVCFLISILLELKRIRKLLEAKEKRRVVECEARAANLPDRPAN
jgi:hypothetical protein